MLFYFVIGYVSAVCSLCSGSAFAVVKMSTVLSLSAVTKLVLQYYGVTFFKVGQCFHENVGGRLSFGVHSG